MNINELKILINTPNTKFLCETEDIANQFLNILYDLGYQWYYHNKKNRWKEFKENTCYSISSIEKGKILLGYKQLYNNKGNVISVSELLTGRKPFKLHR